MGDEDRVNFAKILLSVNFNLKNDSHSTRRSYFENNLQKRVQKNLNSPLSLPVCEVEDGPDDDSQLRSDILESDGVQFIIPSNSIDTWTRLEVLLGLKLSGHTDTLTEPSNFIKWILWEGWMTKRTEITERSRSI